MSSPAAIPVEASKQRRRPIPPGKSAPYFFGIAALVMLAIMVAGFHPYYLRGKGLAGREIAPELMTLVLVHGGALTAWLILFFAQSLLVRTRRLRLHRKLGWCGAAVACIGAVSGLMVAVESVRPAPDIPFWGMTYRQFLMVMLAEMTLFVLFVFAGVLFRKRPATHRAMMLLASLSILAGATVRMPILLPVFGEAGWAGIFGPIFTLGAGFLLVRSLLGRALDRPLAAGYALMVVTYLGACEFAVSETWNRLAKTFFKV